MSFKKEIPIPHLVFIGFMPSFLKKIIYKLKGHKIDKKVKLGFGSIIIGKKIEIGYKARIGFFTIINSDTICIKPHVKIGSLNFIKSRYFEIGEGSKTNEFVIVGGMLRYCSSLIIGEGCHIMQSTFINPTYPVKIGNNVGIGGNCSIFSHSSRLSVLDGFPVTYEPVEIQDNVWLAWNVFIYPGVIVKRNSIISAGSVVMGNIPENAIVSGNPARVKIKRKIHALDADERFKKLKEIFEVVQRELEYTHAGLKTNYGGQSLKLWSTDGLFEIVLIGTKSLNIDKPTYPNNVLIIDFDADIKKLLSETSYNQILCLNSNLSAGSSEVGVAMQRYFSQFGIRFKNI